MAFDLWFPLAVFHRDLGLAAETLAHLAAAARRVDPTDAPDAAAWTGDVHGDDGLHHDRTFDPLTEAVAAGVWAYLEHVGHRVDDLDVLVQRAWPVVAGPGQTVAPHVHPMAHLSAVVHLEAPAGAGGELRFLNAAALNELAVGAGSGGSTDAGPQTFGAVSYQPVPGRLFVFPAKQRHDVLPHHGSGPRVSVAYDLVVCSRWDRPGGVHEFVMPPPERWRRMSRPAGPGPAPAGSSFDLAALSRLPQRPRHAFAEPFGHPLWDVSIQHDAVLRTPASGSVDSGALDSDALTGVFRAAVDAVDTRLAASGVATLGATVGAPTLVCGTAVGASERPGCDLVAWVGLATTEPVAIEVRSMASGATSGSTERYAVPARALVLVGGYRSQRVLGGGPVLRIPFTVPALARPGHASSAQGCADGDLESFLAATAVPLAAAAPSAQDTVAAADTCRRRAETRLIAELSERLLDRGEALAGSPAVAADRGEVVVDPGPPLLAADDCDRLIAHAQDHLSAARADSVDGYADYQVDLDLEQLRALVGEATTDRLYAALPPGIEPESLFVRHFSGRTRPYLPFHHDVSAWTVNVPLEDPARITGGELVVLEAGRPRVVERRRGCAIGHSGDLVHGVRRMTSGERWSLIALCAPTASTDRPPTHPRSPHAPA